MTADDDAPATPHEEPQREARGAPRREALVPEGPGLVTVRLRLAEADVVLLGALLAGYDGLAQLHGLADGTLALVTTDSRAAELADVLDGLSDELAFERL